MELSLENLQQFYGKTAIYTFRLPPGDEGKIYEYQNEIEEHFPQSNYMNGFWSEDSYFEFQERNGKLFLSLEELDIPNFTDCVNVSEADDDLDHFHNLYSDLLQKVNSPGILNDGMCLAGCPYHAGTDGFCSTCKNLNPDEYRVRHSERIKDRYKSMIKSMLEFAEDPSPSLELSYIFNDNQKIKMKLLSVD